MSELKAGDTKTFELAGVTLIVEPIPYGRLKKLIRLLSEVSKSFAPGILKDDFLMIVPKVVEEYVDQFIPQLFDLRKHPFLTKEWVEENMTIPMTKDVIVAAIAINGLGDFFVKQVKQKPAVDPALLESNERTIPSGNSPSTMPQDSPTGGDLVTSTS